MAPQKLAQAGRSADATQHAPRRQATSQWVIEEIDVYGATNEEEPKEEETQQQYSDVLEIEMSPKAKKPRPPRKQQLQQRMETKGSPLREEEPDPEPLYNVSKRRAMRMKKIDKEVSRLEQLVFRDTAPVVQGMDLNEVGLVEEVVTSLEREWCREGNSAAATLAALEGKSNEDEPAWIDEEDEQLTIDMAITKKNIGRRRKTPMPATSKDKYGNLLKSQYQSLVGTPKWATLDNTVKKDADDSSFDRHCGELLVSGSGTLAPTRLQFSRLSDVTEKVSNKRTIITAVDFHPRTQAVVVTNRPGLATFYQIDGKENTKIQSVMFDNFPICTAKFAVDGSELLLGSEYRTYLQSYDMNTGRALQIPCPVSGPEINSMSNFCLSPDGRMLGVSGRDGSVMLMTARSREWIGTVKMSGKCHALTFNSDGSSLLTYGKEGSVYVWNVGERRCIHRFHDDGCLQGLSLAVSPDDRYVACGSGSGVVNIYTGATVLPKAANSGLSESPCPSKAIMNLTTAAHQVVFNSSSQLLATVSRCKDSAVKLVHLPSLTVYSNFPTRDLELARPEAVAFSPNGGYLAIGNNIGAVRLLRLHHFANY